MKRITKIEENKALSVKKKTLVAAYCRVSTASDEQLISLDTQKAHYEDYIKSNVDWEYAGIFYDEGITGTKKGLWIWSLQSPSVVSAEIPQTVWNW